MTNPQIKNTLLHLTSEPGVYRMLDEHAAVIYVGKASNLKKRVTSYFTSKNHSTKTKALVAQIHSLDITVTRSEKEALLLECTLIKTLRPKYNILMRDDKSFPYLFIQQGHPYPRMKVLRLKHDPKPDSGHFFGPYPSAQVVYQTIHLLQTIFKLRNCQDTDFAHRTRPCLQYQIKRCTAPCVGFISEVDYKKSVNDALRFLQGKDASVFKEFQEKLHHAASLMAYEEAAIWRDKIKNLRMVQESQAMICLQGELDVLTLIVKQGFAGICRVSIREGKVLTSDVFFPKIPDIHWYGSAEEVWQAVFSYFITYYYAAHPQQIPREIICENAIQDEQMLLDFLKETSGYPTRFLKPSRGQKKDWLAFANNNLSIAIKAHENSWNLIQHRYHALAKFINIKTISRMECFDISHTQGAQTVASCVVFDAQGPYKKDYRHYHIQDITPGDDYAAMKQVLERRCKYYLEHPNQIPQLVIIDGGKGQVNVARDVLKDFIHQGLIVLGVSKGPSRKAGMEKLLIANENIEQTLAKDNEALHLLQHIRDESHRFAITFHRNRRQKKSLESSLEKIPGVGGGRHKLLLQRFGGLRELRGASIEEIAKVSSIGYDLAKRIFEHLREN